MRKSRPNPGSAPHRFLRSSLATGTLAAYAFSGAVTNLPAQAVNPSRTNPAGQGFLVVRFDIPAGTLEEVLRQFETKTGWQIDLPDPAMAALPCKGLSALLPPAQGLAQLLRGTGLTYKLTGPARAVLAFEVVSSSIDVVESVPLSSPRHTAPLRDLPQAITVIPGSVIQQQGATSLAEVLKNVPGITITAGEGGVPSGDNLTLRGNSARNDIFVDGVRDLSPQTRDPFNLEQVEVNKGPSPAVAARGSAGGAINLISKAPSVARALGGSFFLGNAGTRRATLDVNLPLSRVGLGHRTALRLNGMVHDSGVAGRNAVAASRWGLAPSLAFGLGTPTRLTLSYFKLKQDNISDYGIPWVPATHNALREYRDRPAPVPRETFYGFRTRDRELLNQDSGTARIEHDFSDSLQLRSQLRIADSSRNSIATPPRFASSDSTVINREMRSWIAADRILDSQTDFSASPQTWGIRHSLTAGAALTHEGNRRTVRTAPVSPTTLLNPNPDDVYTGTFTTSPFAGDITAKTRSLWLFDTLRFNRSWEATGGVRWERFAVNGVSTVPAPVRQTVNYASLRAGLVYKPVEAGSIYASFGNSVSPSLEGLSYNTSNTAIPPEKTYTGEVGTKWEVSGSRLLLTAALFQTRKDNARTPGLLPTDPPQVLAGRQVSQGLELSASGGITRSVRVLASYSLIDARILHSNTPAEVGRRFQNTPRNSASVWITFTARKFTLGAGPRFIGRRYGNNANTRRVDAYTTIDAMVSYQFNRHLDLRFNLSNLNDEYYFERLGGGHVVPGPGRYGMFTTNFHF